MCYEWVCCFCEVESEADRLARIVRVFCLVMTTPAHHDSRAVHVLATWGRRCTKIMFVSEQLDSRLPIIHVNVTTGRKELTVKHRLAWDVVYRWDLLRQKPVRHIVYLHRCQQNSSITRTSVHIFYTNNRIIVVYSFYVSNVNVNVNVVRSNDCR